MTLHAQLNVKRVQILVILVASHNVVVVVEEETSLNVDVILKVMECKEC